MLAEQKITLEAKTIVEGIEVATHRAVMTADKITFLPYHTDDELRKTYRKEVRADQGVFEDNAYKLQETVFPKAETVPQEETEE